MHGLAVPHSKFEAARVGYERGLEEARAAHAHEEHPPIEEFQEIDTSSALSRYSLYIVVGYLAIGCAFFSWSEDWSWDDALYFSIVTMTTVGYGDLVPTTDASKIFAIFYIIFGAPAMGPRPPRGHCHIPTKTTSDVSTKRRIERMTCTRLTLRTTVRACAAGLSFAATCLGLVVAKLQGMLDSTLSRLPRSHRHMWSILTSLGTIGSLVAIGATFVSWSEGWEPLDAMYWAVVTSSSVGYGDLTTENQATRWFNSVYLLFAVGGFAVSLSKFGTVVIEIEAEKAVNECALRCTPPLHPSPHN